MVIENGHQKPPDRHPISEEEKPSRKMVYVEPKDGTYRAYANNVQAAQTVFDARVIFGEVINVTDEEIVIEQRVQITMSWAELKIVNEFLAQHIKAFEDKNGPIKIPTAVANPLQPSGPEEPKQASK